MAKQKLVVFFSGESRYGVPIECTERIVPSTPLTRLPGMPTSVQGVFDWRGETVPVLDAQARFGLTGTLANGDNVGTQFIIVKSSGQRMAVAVDRVDEIAEIEEGEIEDNPDITGLGSDGIVKGIGRLGEHLLVVLNPEVLCRAA